MTQHTTSFVPVFLCITLEHSKAQNIHVVCSFHHGTLYGMENPIYPIPLG